MRRWLLGLTMCALAGCDGDIPGISCEESSDCPGGSECLQGPGGGVCTELTCEPACTGLTECVGTQCLPTFEAVVLESPAPSSDHGREITVVASLTQREGSVREAPAKLKVFAIHSDGGQLDTDLVLDTASGKYRGQLVVLRGGRYTLTVKVPDTTLESSVTVSVHHCPSVCEGPRVCVLDSCELGFASIALTAPAAGRIEGDRANVTAELTRLTAVAEATPPAEISLVAARVSSGEETTLALVRVGETLQYAGELVVTHGGEYDLRASFSSSPQKLESSLVRVLFAGCPQGCGTYEGCSDGLCHGVFSSIEITAPADAAWIGGSGPIAVRARLSRSSEGTEPAPPDTLSLGVAKDPVTSSLPMSRVAGTDEYVVDWTPAEDGTWTLTAANAELSLSSTPVSVPVDRTAPEFGFEVVPPTRENTTSLKTSDPQTGYETAHRRDEKARVRVFCTEAGIGLDTSTLAMTVKGIPNDGVLSFPSSALQTSTNCTSGTEGCCFETEVDLADSNLKMEAFRGTFALSVSGADKLANASTGSGGIPVTRWKWRLDANPATPHQLISRAPAIGKDGRVYFARGAEVYVATPDGGATLLLSTAAPITSNIIVTELEGKEWLAVGGSKQQTPGVGAFWAFPLDAAATGPGSSAGAMIASGVAFTSVPKPAFLAPLTTATDPRVAAIIRDTNEATGFAADTYTEPSVGFTDRTGVAITGDTIFLGDNKGNLRGYGLLNDNLSVKTGWPQSVGEAPTNPIVTSSGIAGGGGGVGVGSVFQFPVAGAVAPTKTTTNSPTWNAVATSDGIIVAGDEDGYVHFVPEDSPPAASESPVRPGTSQPIKAAPAVGSDGSLYVSGSDGQLHLFSGKQVVWSQLLEGSLESPTLDCSRDGALQPLARPGILYVGTSTGALFAIITDSRGLDVTSPWPKLHHDPGNTSNASVSLAPFACP